MCAGSSTGVPVGKWSPSGRPKGGSPAGGGLPRVAIRRASVREDAPAGAAVEGVAPERLNGERARRELDVARGALARADPGALVAVLRALPVEPAAVRELVGDRLRELVGLDDRDPRLRAEAVAVGPARGARVGDVRQGRVGDA